MWTCERQTTWSAGLDFCVQTIRHQPANRGGSSEGAGTCTLKMKHCFVLISIARFLLLTPLNSTSLIYKNQEVLANAKWRPWQYSNSKDRTGITWLITYLLKSYCLFYCRSVNKNQSWDVNLSSCLILTTPLAIVLLLTCSAAISPPPLL